MPAQSPGLGGIANTVATVGAGLLNTALNNRAQRKLNESNKKWQERMTQQQNEFNAKEAQRQRDWSLHTWDLQNEYNAPAAQVARLKAAGLNPNLVYGNGSAVATAGAADSGSAASAAGTPTPATSGYDYSGLSSGIANSLAAFQNWRQNESNIQNTEAATNLSTQRSISEMFNQNWTFSRDQAQRIENMFSFDTFDTRKRLFHLGYNTEQVNNAIKRQELTSLSFQNAFTRATWNYKVNSAFNAALQSGLDLRKTIAQIGLFDAQAKNQRSLAALNGLSYRDYNAFLGAGGTNYGNIFSGTGFTALNAGAGLIPGMDGFSSLSRLLRDTAPFSKSGYNNYLKPLFKKGAGYLDKGFKWFFSRPW